MWHRLFFFGKRLQERLWIRPLFFCILSVAAAFLARAADELRVDFPIPAIASDSIETLLSITAGSMLVIATLAVTSMVSAYASASSSATPRSFSLLVADDLSQNALSTFLGAFIFTFVALVALKNGFYGQSGLLVLFLMTVVVVAFVIVTFVRWVDWIARLGRIGTTIDKVEAAGADAITRRRLNPRLGGAKAGNAPDSGSPVEASRIGYVQHVNVEALQECAGKHDLQIEVIALPGTFVGPGRPLARVRASDGASGSSEASVIRGAFEIGDSRVYDDDPRFALIGLSEIASRALSPAVNDPGTAITIFGAFIRLFSLFSTASSEDDGNAIRFDRVFVPDISVDDMLEDAFRAIARDGAGLVEVQIRLQKSLATIAAMPHDELARAARRQSRSALDRARATLDYEPDIDAVAEAAAWSA